MAHVHVPRSLAALFPGVPRRLDLEAPDLVGLIRELDARYPGMWDRLCEPGPRLRPHIRAFVDGQPATLQASLVAESVVHIIPAVSGGAGRRPPCTLRLLASARCGYIRLRRVRTRGREGFERTEP